MGREQVNERVQFIINPTSGGSTAGARVAGFRERLRQLGVRPEMYVTARPDDARRFAGTLDRRTDAVVVVGGDGTVSEVAGGLMDHPIPMWVLPTGTENLLAKQVGYGHDPDAMVDALRNRRVGTCDLGLIDDRPWLINVGVGFDAEVVRQVVASRKGHIMMRDYFWPIWRTFWAYDYPALRIIADGQEVFNAPGVAFVGNMPRYASGMMLFQKARCDDGLLDLCAFRCRSPWELLALYGVTVARRHLPLERVTYRHCRSLIVQSDRPVPCQADGDEAGSLPATICVVPGRVSLLLPRDAPRGFLTDKETE